MKRPDIDGIEPSIADYINYIEGCLNGSNELILELNMTSRVFAEDLRAYRTGEGEVKYIGKADKTKKFEHVMALFDKFDKIKALAAHFKQAEKEKTTGNTFEDVSKKVQAKLNGTAK